MATTPCEGVYPLLNAAAEGDEHRARWLLLRGACPNTGDVLDADTPLAAAARNNDVAMVALLLAWGAKPGKIAFCGGGDARQIATRAKAKEVVALLNAVIAAKGRKRRAPVSGPACPVCQKTFNCPSKLKRHSVVHSRSRPFLCTDCGKGFTQKPSLQTHLKRCKKGK